MRRLGGRLTKAECEVVLSLIAWHMSGDGNTASRRMDRLRRKMLVRVGRPEEGDGRKAVDKVDPRQTEMFVEPGPHAALIQKAREYLGLPDVAAAAGDTSTNEASTVEKGDAK